MIRVRRLDPRSIGNLALWLDASDAPSLGAWADKSGLGRNASQVATNNQPALTGTIGGKPALFFDGINDNFALPPIALSAWHAFAVCQPTSNKTLLYIAANGSQSFSLAPSTSGIVTASGSGTGQNNPSWVDSRVGAAWSNGALQSFYAGLVGEVLVYSSALTSDQAAAVTRYLQAKWSQ